MDDKSTQTAPQLPPDEKFWQRYSPHHEMPLSGMTSLFAHALVVGVLLFAGYLVSLRWHGEADKPPRMDVVMIEGGPGDLEGIGGPEGLPGQSERTELTPSVAPERPMTAVESSPLQFDDAPTVELFVPAETRPSETKDSLSEQLDKIAKEASQAVAAKKTAAGTNNPKGVGGKGGIGDAPGPGKGKTGTGKGLGGPPGKLTQQQIYAWRWRFELLGSGKEHADKLAAVGVVLVVPDQQGQFWIIRDFRRRPVNLQKENVEKYRDAVTWKNTDQRSMFELARELQLPFVPQFVVMLLPKDREQQMARAEAAFAQQQRRDLLKVQATHFDFLLRGDSFEPVVLRME
jgi:hypothetical protein